jgi:hypothetical protein
MTGLTYEQALMNREFELAHALGASARRTLAHERLHSLYTPGDLGPVVRETPWLKPIQSLTGTVEVPLMGELCPKTGRVIVNQIVKEVRAMEIPLRQQHGGLYESVPLHVLLARKNGNLRVTYRISWGRV